MSLPTPTATVVTNTHSQTPLVRRVQAALQPNVYALPHPYIYSIGKYFIGKAKELPPPEDVRAEWEKHLGELEAILRHVTSRLSGRSRPGETGTSLSLCMAGKKCCTPITLSPCINCAANRILLKPTIWVFCGSRRCKDKVRHEFSQSSLPLLAHFLNRFGMESPRFSREILRPIGRTSPDSSGASHETIRSVSVSFSTPVYNPRLNGAQIKFTIETSRGGFITHYSTLGGVIRVDDRLYCLTTCHAVVNEYFHRLRDVGDIDDESLQDTSWSSGSDFESDSDSGESCRDQTKYDGLETPDSDDIMHWRSVQAPEVMAYLGCGTTSGDWLFPESVSESCDFTLLTIPSDHPYYTWNINDMGADIDPTPVISHASIQDLTEGPISIIASNKTGSYDGYLLSGSASVILKGKIMQTRLIQVKSAGAPGLSGAWVVRGTRLYGVVFASYGSSPYIHMLPADTVFADIKSTLHCSKARVAIGWRDAPQNYLEVQLLDFEDVVKEPFKHDWTQNLMHKLRMIGVNSILQTQGRKRLVGVLVAIPLPSLIHSDIHKLFIIVEDADDDAVIVCPIINSPSKTGVDRTSWHLASIHEDNVENHASKLHHIVYGAQQGPHCELEPPFEVYIGKESTRSFIYPIFVENDRFESRRHSGPWHRRSLNFRCFLPHTRFPERPSIRIDTIYRVSRDTKVIIVGRAVSQNIDELVDRYNMYRTNGMPISQRDFMQKSYSNQIETGALNHLPSLPSFVEALLGTNRSKAEKHQPIYSSAPSPLTLRSTGAFQSILRDASDGDEEHTKRIPI